MIGQTKSVNTTNKDCKFQIQPSDLLGSRWYFFQKNKVGKSFLRLSFYNKNPNTSDLLYIFMNKVHYIKKPEFSRWWYMSVEVENNKRKNSIIYHMTHIQRKIGKFTDNQTLVFKIYN